MRKQHSDSEDEEDDKDYLDNSYIKDSKNDNISPKSGGKRKIKNFSDIIEEELFET